MRKLCFILLVIYCAEEARGQTSFADQQKETKSFILGVISSYQNPMAYYPLRRDIFLPTEEEMAKDEMEKSYPEGVRSLGNVLFVSANDTTYQRESFVDEYGDPLDLRLFRTRTLPSRKSNGDFFRRKQQYHLKQYPKLGKFLYFNSRFGSL